MSGSVASIPNPYGLPTIGNFDLTRLYKWRAAMTRQNAGGAFAKIAFYGDSITSGALSNATVNLYRLNGFPPQLATMFNASGCPANWANAFGNGDGPAGLGAAPGIWDSRLSGTGAFATIAGTGNMLGGYSFYAAATGTLSFAPGATSDSVDIYYFDQTGVFTINIDGGATLATLTMANSSTFKKFTLSYTPGIHTINVVYVSGGGYIVGFDCYTSTSAQVHIWNLGCGGATAAALAANVNPTDALAAFLALAPDLTVLMVGTNDWIPTNNVTVASFSTAVQAIITAAEISGDTIIMTPSPSAGSGGGSSPVATQALYVAALKSLALSNKIPIIDENFNLVSKAQMTSYGLGADTYHPNFNGYGVIAKDILSALMPVTYSTNDLTSFVSLTGNAPLLRNATTQNTYNFRSALARQATGGAFCKIAFIGDSTFAGAISNASLSGYRPNCWIAQLATLMTADGVPACMTNAFGNADGPAGATAAIGIWDSRLVGTGTLGPATANVMIGGTSANGTAAGTLTFSPGTTSDTCDFYYYDQAGTFTYNIGGGSLGTITLTATSLVKKSTVTFTAGVNAIQIVWASGSWNFAGFDAYLSTTPQIHLWNLGSGGATAAALSVTTGTYFPIYWYPYMAPDLSIISIGINDWIAGTAIAAFTASVQTIITQCLISGDVILMTPFPSNSSQATLANQLTYANAIRNLALSNNIPLIDQNYNFVSKVSMTAHGLGSDVNHPNYQGHGVVALDVWRALRTIM